MTFNCKGKMRTKIFSCKENRICFSQDNALLRTYIWKINLGCPRVYLKVYFFVFSIFSKLSQVIFLKNHLSQVVRNPLIYQITLKSISNCPKPMSVPMITPKRDRQSYFLKKSHCTGFWSGNHYHKSKAEEPDKKIILLYVNYKITYFHPNF